MDGYLPLEHFREGDRDRSSRPIRDFPRGKAEFDLQLFPAKVEFPPTRAGSSSLPASVLLANTGFSRIELSDVRAIGPFEIRGSRPRTIEPGEVREISVVFSPSHDGPAAGGLHVDSASGAGQEFVPFSGAGSQDAVPIPAPVVRQVEPSVVAVMADQNQPDVFIRIVPERALPQTTELRRVFFAVPVVKANTGQTLVARIAGIGDRPIVMPDGSDRIPSGYLRPSRQAVFEWTGTVLQIVA